MFKRILVSVIMTHLFRRFCIFTGLFSSNLDLFWLTSITSTCLRWLPPFGNPLPTWWKATNTSIFESQFCILLLPKKNGQFSSYGVQCSECRNITFGNPLILNFVLYFQLFTSSPNVQLMKEKKKLISSLEVINSIPFASLSL